MMPVFGSTSITTNLTGGEQMAVAVVLLGLLVMVLFVGLVDLTNKVDRLERQAGLKRGGKHGKYQS